MNSGFVAAKPKAVQDRPRAAFPLNITSESEVMPDRDVPTSTGNNVGPVAYERPASSEHKDPLVALQTIAEILHRLEPHHRGQVLDVLKAFLL